MSDDEVAAAAVAFLVACATAVLWYVPLLTVTPLAGKTRIRWALGLAPPACLALVAPVLRRWAAADVRDDGRYIALFLAVAAAFVGTTLLVARPLLGLSARDDALERDNDAATIAACAAALAVALCCAGSNIGEGTTIWQTIGPCSLAVAALYAGWATYAVASGVMEAITVDRDAASAWRFAGVLVAMGLILGRAVAGNYHSADETIRSFGQVSFAIIPLLIFAVRLNLWKKDESTAALPIRIDVPRPSRFRVMSDGFFERLGLRRSLLGGLGGSVSEPAGGGEGFSLPKRTGRSHEATPLHDCGASLRDVRMRRNAVRISEPRTKLLAE